jgi:hypothetical protein
MEQKSIWKEVAVTYLKMLSCHYSGEAEQTHGESVEAQSVSQPWFELRTNQMRYRLSQFALLFVRDEEEG